MSYLEGCDIRPLNESTAVIYFGKSIDIITLKRITAFNAYLKSFPFEGLCETVPAYTSLTITYDPLVVRESQTLAGDFAFSRVTNYIEHLLRKSRLHPIEGSSPGIHQLSGAHLGASENIIEIPVTYGGAYGPDLNYVAEQNKLTPDEVIFLHSQPIYTVYMIGFLPGFPYLGGMNKTIACSRKATPGKSVASGSVGIAGEQTGVYPMQSPGGWQLIGRTPISLFNPFNAQPAVLSPGATIKFFPISAVDFCELNYTDANKGA